MKPQAFQQPLRVLHLMSTYRWTGVAEPAVSLAKWVTQFGHDAWVAGIWGRSFEEEARARGVRLAKEIPLSLDYNPFRQAKLIEALREFCEAHHIDIVHAHLPHDHWIAALAFRWRHRTGPLVVRTYHRYENPRRDPLHRWLFEQATEGVITVSSAQQELLRRAYPGARLEVIFGGVDPERFRFNPEGRARVRADMGEKPGAMVAGLVAHLGYNRGIHWLLAAAPKVVEALPNATIWIVGQGELKEFLRNELRHPKYRRRVLLAGYRTDDLPHTYAAIDVGLLLGLGSEGSARAVLEAMATERPVIAVRKGALIDTISHGVDGFLVEEGDVVGLEQALLHLLGDPALARQMGRAAREKIVTSFTEETRARRTLEFYSQLLAVPRPTSAAIAS
jgi:glycosyltransferase involved in cell wall biosynthesis